MNTEFEKTKINPNLALYVGISLIVLTALGKTLLPGAGVISLMAIVVVFVSVLCLTPKNIISVEAKRALAIAGTTSCVLCYLSLAALSPLITQ